MNGRTTNCTPTRHRAIGVVVTLMLVLGLLAVAAGPAIALPDTEPPMLHGGSLVEAAGVVSDAPSDADRTLHFTASVSDNTTGMNYAQAQFVSPNGNRYFSVSFSVPYAAAIITPVDVMGSAVLPRYSETGIWQLQAFSMGDVATNQVNLSQSEVAATGFPTTFIVSGIEDVNGPALTPSSSSISPGTPLQGDAEDPSLRTFSIDTHITDDLAGVQWVSAQYQLNGQYAYPSFSLTSGDEHDGAYDGTVTLPRYAASGTWQLAQVNMGDRVANQTNLDPASAEALGFPSSFDVTGVDDLTPPTVEAFDFNPKSFNNVGCVTTVDVTAHVTDNLSGVAYIQAYFVGPASQYHYVGLTLASGNETDGIWTGSFSLPFESATGTWNLVQIYDADRTNNAVSLQNGDLVGVMPQTTFEVVAGNGEVCLSPDQTLSEGGGTAVVMASMTTQPAAPVDLAIGQSPGAGASAGTQLTLSPDTVHFTPENWNVLQPVTVGAIDDGITEANPHTATIDGVASSTDPIFDGQTPSAKITITEQSPTLAVTASPTTATGLDGFSSGWSFTLANSGPGNASNPTLTVSVPTGSPGFTITGPGAMDSGFVCVDSVGSGSTVYTCTRNTNLNSGESAIFSLTTDANGADGDTPTITALGTADATDATPASSATAVATVHAPAFDLRVDNEADFGKVSTGDPLTWTATVTNTSTNAESASGIVLTYDLPAGVELASPPTMPGYTCVPPSGVGIVTVTCSDGPPLAPGDKVSLTVATTVTGPSGTTLVTTATANADQTDVNPDDNTAVEHQVDVTVAPSAAIEGTVTDAETGSPLSGIQVRAVQNSVVARPPAASTTTAPDGTYVITGLAVGDYIVQFTDGSGTYGEQFYDHVANFSSASTVTVNDVSDDITGIDAALVSPNQISGTVTSEADGTPLAGICVSAHDPSAPNFNDGAAPRTETASDGTYTLAGLDSTPYIILFRDCSRPPTYSFELYDGGSGTTDPTEATPITPVGPVDGIDAALGTAGSLSGTVFDATTNAGLPNMCVVVYSPDFGPLTVGQTTSDGTYSIGGVAAGAWYIVAGKCVGGDDNFVWYAGATSVPVTIADGELNPSGDGAQLVTVVDGADTPDINLYVGTDVPNDVDIVTTKTVSSATVMTGQTVTWTITATNTSTTNTAVSPDIFDALPDGLTPTNVIGPEGFECSVDASVDPSVVECDAPSLAPGATATLQFDTLIDAKAGAVFENTAEGSARNDTDGSNNEASASVTVAPSAAIEGTVTDAETGIPLSGIQVRVFPNSVVARAPAASTVTAPDGTYVITGLAVGDYIVVFTDGSGNYGEQWYDHVANPSSASTVTVTDISDDITGIDAALESPNQISGTVTAEADGTPLAGICVAALDAANVSNGALAKAVTESDGTYTLAGLKGMPYIIRFRDCSELPKYAFELYDGGSGTTDPTEATPITPVGPVEGIDAALGTGGSVSGTVFDATTNTGLPERCVVVYSPEFGSLAEGQSASDGTYSISGVAAGAWYVEAGNCADGGDTFVWYAGATSTPKTMADTDDPVGDGAQLVTVVGGADTPDVNLYFGTDVLSGVDIVTTKTVSSASVMTGQTVTWTITATNTSMTNTAVSPGISDSLPDGLSPSNVIGPDGFECSVDVSDVECDAPSLAPGATAVLQFDTQIEGKTGAVFENTADAGAKNDTDGSNNEASASVTVAPSAAIEGTVTDAETGSPLSGIQVRVFRSLAVARAPAASTTTAPDGTYAVTGLAVGDYIVQFTDGSGSYGEQFYDHVPNQSSASTVTVNDVSDDITGIDAALLSPNQISGTVTAEADGTPLAGICVSALDATGPTFNNGASAKTETASDGTYTLAGLSSTTPYIIRFRDCSKQPKYAFELYDGGSGTTDPTEAKQITPVGPVDGIDAALGTGGSVSGTVFDATTNTGLPNRCVVVFSPDFGLLAVGQSASDGTYSIGGVPAGAWYVAAGSCNDDGDTDFVWYAGATSIPVTNADTVDPAGDGAHLVTVVGGADTPDINLYFGAAAGGNGAVPTDPAVGTTPIAAPTSTAAGQGTTGNAKATGVTGPLAFTGMSGSGLALAGLVLLGLGLVAMRISETRRWRRSS